MIEVIVEGADASQVAIDRLGLESLAQEVVRVLGQLVIIHRLNGHIHPQHKVLKDVHVVLDRVRGVVASLQEAPVVHDHMAHIHLSVSFQ